MCYVLSLCASCLGYSALLRIHRVTLDDVFLDPLWFFNYKKILWGGYRLYVGPRLYFRASPYLWLRLYLWARLKSICDWLRKGRGGAQAGASRAGLRQITVIWCILVFQCIRDIA